MLVRAPYGFTFEEDRQGCSLVSRNIPKKGLLGGGFPDFGYFSPRKLGKISNLTIIFFSDGLFNHQLGLAG